MKPQNVFIKLAFCLVFFALTITALNAQFSITNATSSLTNNFNSYNPSTSGNLTTTVNSTNVLTAITGTGWTASSSGTANYGGQTPSTATGGYWGFGSAGSFGLGGLRSGTPGNITYTVSFVNNSGGTITSITLGWDYKQHSYNNTSGWNVTGTGQLAANATLNAKDFAGSATGSGITTTAVSSFTLTGLTIANGQSFGLTWVTTDITGSDNCVSIDNFSIATSGSTPVPVVSDGSTSGTVGTAFTAYNLSTLSTNSPTSYTIVSGSVPGLTINTTSGAITGTPTTAGTYPIVFNATNGGGTSASNATLTITIAKGNQTITFNTPASVPYGTAPGTLTATSSSGLAVSFTSATPSVAALSGTNNTTITYGVVGSSNITASQAGDANWNAASAVVRSQVVTQKALTITGLTGVNKVYDGTTPTTATGTATLNGVLAGDVGNVTLSGTPAFNFNTATVGTSKPITVTGYTLSGSAAANYTVTQPTGLTANVTVKTITVSGAVASNKTYDGTNAATITGATLSGVETADIGNVLCTTGTFASVNVGTGIAVTAILTGSAAGNYTFTPPALTANITKANQTITFNALADKTTASAPFALTATASSGLAVSYTSSNTAVATVTGSMVTVQGVGTTIITASQAGNSNYNAATDVTQSQLVTVPAGPLATYLFTGNPGVLTPSSVSANVTFGNVSGNTINQNSNVSNVYTGSVASGTWGSSFSSTRYLEFTITPASGFTLTASSFDMDVFRSSAGATNYAIRSSIDGYAADLATGSVTTTQTAIPNVSLSSLSFSNLTTLTFRIYGWGGGSSGDFRLDNITVNGFVVSSCTTPIALAFQTQPVSSAQDVVIPVSVKAICSGGNTATGLNTGSVTISTNNTGCGLEVSGSPVSSVTANFVNGVATFNNVSFSRSTQNNVSFITTNTQSLTNVTSNNFNITAPVGGSPTNTTIVNETFETTTQWPYTVGTPTYDGSGGGGTDVVSVKTFSSNKSLCKSYSINNSSGEKRSTTTITFDNQNISAYNYATFSFQLASLGSGSGAGVDGGDDYVVQISLDGGTTWSTTLTYYGNNDYLIPFSTTPVTSLNYNSNASYTSGTKSAFSVQLPNNTSQFRFRVTATNNRNNENWAIDNIQLVGTTIPLGAQLVLPTATGGTVATCPNTNNTLSIITANTVGAVTYSWSPTTNMTPSAGNTADPIVNPATGTTYTATITDADGCKATATQVITVPTGTAGTWTGAENSDWFQCRNWGDGIVPTASTNVTIPNPVTNIATIDPLSTFATPVSGIAYANNITINTSGQLIGLNNADLRVSGNWDNDGTFTPGTSTVNFTGSGTSTIDGTSATQFNNLAINKQVQLLVDASTDGVGTLAVNQKLDLNGHVFTVNNLANTAITRTSPGHVLSETQNGAARLLWQMDDFSYSDNYVFPMGNSNGDYLPVTFKLNSGFIGLAGVATYNSAAATVWPTGSENVTSVANPTKAVQRFWHLESDQAANSYNADVTFSFPGSEDPTIGLGPDVKFQRYNKPTDTWDLPLTTQTYTFGTTRSVLVQGITKFSWWGGGNDATNPLPIELLTFTAKHNGEIVELKWATATETNNDYYTIERSADAINFEPVAVVAGAGNSNTMLAYETRDDEPLSGLSYYRLKQTDFNGDFSYSQIVPVQFESKGFDIVRSFVNAANQIELWVNNDNDEVATLTIYDTQGKILHSIKQPITKGINRLSYAINGLANGIYFIQIQMPTKLTSIKIVNQGR